jgi:hypothetical protein
MLNIKEKEQLIIGTILSCNEEIKKVSLLLPSLNENLSKQNMYHFNMVQLFQEINPLFESSLNFQIPENSIYIKNTRGNYHAYFQKVYDFLDGYEINLQKTLNESLNVDNSLVENPVQLDIMTFKDDLKRIINELVKKNDLDTIPQEILKIKILAQKSLIVNGFDISNNLSLQKELFEKFNTKISDLLSICYDRSNKQLLFVPKNTQNIITYDLTLDQFDLYNVVNHSNPISSKTLTIQTYLTILRDLINNSIITIYNNMNEFKFESGDNLYFDKLRNKINTENGSIQQPSVIKK